MIKQILGVFFLLKFFAFNIAFAQKSNELNPTDTELIILFTVAILVVIGIIIYITREIIAKKKTDYDEGKFESQKNKDYEKYHSDWGDDYEELGEKSTSEYDEEFRKASQEGLPNYYEILGIAQDATHNEIKQQYRKLAKEVHPDKTKKNSEEQMSEINKAYEILSDKEKRERYDKFLNVS